MILDSVATPVTNDISSILTALGQVTTFLIGKMSDMVDLVLAQPLLLIPIGVVLTLTVVSIFKKIF